MLNEFLLVFMVVQFLQNVILLLSDKIEFKYFHLIHFTRLFSLFASVPFQTSSKCMKCECEVRIIDAASCYPSGVVPCIDVSIRGPLSLYRGIGARI